MQDDLVANASVTIEAPATTVWRALVTPADIKQYMFGTTVVSDWRVGTPITWKGEWKGKPYEDKGLILTFDPEQSLRYTHFSPLGGLPDRPENYHTVSITLAREKAGTRVTLSQDGNADQQAREHSEKNWSAMLTELKKFVEGKASHRS